MEEFVNHRNPWELFSFGRKLLKFEEYNPDGIVVFSAFYFQMLNNNIFSVFLWL